MVIKCQSKTANDLTNQDTTVVDIVYRQPGSRAKDGWQYKVCEKTLMLQRNVKDINEQYSVTFKLPYIQHH